MNDIDKYIVNDPTPEEVEDIKSALTKSEDFVREIIVCAEDIEETNGKIDELVKLANKQKENKIGWFSGKATAIESLQALADFQADAIKDLWKYQKLVFEQFSKLSETSNKLLLLGVANAAVTRAIIGQLKSKTSKPLSEDARRHLLNVIEELERQADAQDRINRLRDATSSAFINEAHNRQSDIAAVYTFIDGVKESFSDLIDNETKNRIEVIREITFSLNEIKENYALASALSQESEDRISALTDLRSEIADLEVKLANYCTSIDESIRSTSNSHSSKEEILQNEIYQLQSKNKLSIWIASIATILSVLSICANFLL